MATRRVIRCARCLVVGPGHPHRLPAGRDFRDTETGAKDRRRLRSMIAACRDDERAMAVPGAAVALDRLVRAADL